MKDVAALAGVSVGTVSNVLNRPHLVSAETTRRVQEAISELGFVRNETARQLRAGRSRTIAYVVLDAGNPFFHDVARGVEEAARAEGVAVYLCNSDQDPLHEREYLERLREQRVQGVLITPIDPAGELLAQMPDSGTPVVLVDAHSGDASRCSVAVDDVLGGQLAATHLLESGHERIAFVGGPLSVPQVRDRHRGACRALAEAGRAAEALVVLETGALQVAEGRLAGERLAALPAERRPTAAFCANDLLALGLLQAMTRLGRSVPADLAVVGYDDIVFAEAAAVPLTSVRQPRELLGRTAVQLLFEEAAAEPGHVHRQIRFRPELVVRASTDAG
ncbi:LacI family DNA-binding transcriptional regulator [Actinophytocola xanthii]|uniref:LacI family transcriptional regulator n=1 Tax=Actinophytocola xanthii TaxID=1912961 RepID=A0A1Q8CYI0_9PSEU|nr:LacI family DNA-binding transcriptional regulator [Actinophytocola xanthii]OLF19410.1 LacI family transcriptional regulator [Actinophytocola xanthii]